MNYGSYILTCVQKEDIDELKKCWYWLGSRTATNATPMYIKDSLYIIQQPDAPYNGYLFYSNADYRHPIDWTHITAYSQAMHITSDNGVTVQTIHWLNVKLQDTSIVPETITEAPFSKYKESSSDIIIDTDTYYQIMSCVGVPFIREEELEYNRQAILKLAIEPALKVYFSMYPLEVPETKRITGPYDIVLPPMAMNAHVQATHGVGGTSFNTMGGMGTFGFGTMYSSSHFGSGRFGAPTYVKPVPGYTGLDGEQNSIGQAMDGLTLINSLRNLSDKQRVDVIKEADGRHLKGYANSACTLNITWLCWSRNWDDTDPMDFKDLFKLCQASVKKTLGPIYALLQDNTLPVNSKELKQEGIKEWDEVVNKWDESAWNKVYTVSKGGVMF